MKILHIINRMSTGGAEKMLTELVPHQLSLGNDVTVLQLCSGEAWLEEKLVAVGCPVISIGKKLRDVYNPLIIFRLRKYLHDYDIIHVHLFPAQYWIALSCCFLKKHGRLVTTEHSTYNKRRKIIGIKWLERYIYHHYDSIIAISHATAAELRNYLGPDLKISTVFNGIDTTVIFNASTLDRSQLFAGAENTVLLVQVARFSMQKDKITTIRALQYLPKHYHLVCAGDGPRRIICEEEAEACGVRCRVHFLGTYKNVPALLKASDIVVMSSSVEGFGLAAVEGMAAGKPVVASDIPGLKEIVQGAGLLFETHNPEQLAERVIQLESLDLYTEIANRCIKRAKEYDISDMAEQYNKIYQTLLMGQI